jgi:O-antigen ligase
MLEKYINLDIYQSNKHNQMRKIALVLTSLIPLFLLFSRTTADVALTITGILFFIHCVKAKDYSFIKQPIAIVLLLLWLWFMVSSIVAIHPINAFAISFVFIRYILFFFACIFWIFEETTSLKFAAKIITITLIVVASDALWQFITGFSITGHPKYDGVRLTSFFEDRM